MDFLLQIDITILNFISITLKNCVFDFLMPLITSTNNHGEIWLVIAAIFLVKKDTRNIGITILVALALSGILGGVIKDIFERHRPYPYEHDYKYLISIPGSYSFPSSHTSSSFAAFGAIWFSKSKYRYPAMVLAITIAFSRMYVRVHYPTDVVGGIILGLFCAKIAMMITSSERNPIKTVSK